MKYIPYFKTSRYRVVTMINLAKIQPGEKFADLGSGDGRIVLAAAQAGAHTVGFELDSQLADRSRELLKQANVQTTASIIEKDFWNENLSHYAIITIYPMPDIMKELEQKLQKELTSGARVLLNYYQFPNWKYTKTKDHIYLYVK